MFVTAMPDVLFSLIELSEDRAKKLTAGAGAGLFSLLPFPALSFTFVERGFDSHITALVSYCELESASVSDKILGLIYYRTTRIAGAYIARKWRC